MRRAFYILFMAVLFAVGCAREEARRFDVRGQVVAVDATRQEITLKHDDIRNFMPAMTMPFRVADGVDGLRAGDLVTATLVVERDGAHLAGLQKIGSAPLPTSGNAPPARSGFELLREGDEAPDVTFVDQDGRSRTLAELRGQAVALTFIYTRCPLPNFCPMMDRNFAAIQRALNESAALRGKVQLLSISFDPAYDTPAVLQEHARGLGAEPGTWSFLTGDRDEIDRFAARFGVSVVRSQTDERDITHNLRTAVIAPDGKLAKIYTGYDWTPKEVLQDLASVTGT